jgi:hypothetical protein
MSGQGPNERTNFVQVGENKFRSDYMDQKEHSRWVIEVSGDPLVVQEFIKKPLFELDAIPISPEEADARIAQIREKAVRHQERPSGGSLEHASLELGFYLQGFTDPGTPHLVHYSIDPNPPYKGYIELGDSDIKAEVSYETEDGMVELTLTSEATLASKSDGPATHGEVALDNLPPKTRVRTEVTGDPSIVFTTRGDFIYVPPK